MYLILIYRYVGTIKGQLTDRKAEISNVHIIMLVGTAEERHHLKDQDVNGTIIN